MIAEDLFRRPEKRLMQMTDDEKRAEMRRIRTALAVLARRASELRKRIDNRPPIDREQIEGDLGLRD